MSEERAPEAGQDSRTYDTWYIDCPNCDLGILTFESLCQDTPGDTDWNTCPYCGAETEWQVIKLAYPTLKRAARDGSHE